MAVYTIDEESFSRYPGLKAFIESDPPDVSLLGRGPFRYEIIFNFGDSHPFYAVSIIDVCSLYGRSAHIEALNLTDDEKKSGVKANHFRVIRWAVMNGHLETLKHLETHLTADEKKAAVKAKDYEPIRRAAGNGHLETLQYLETHLTEDEKKAAVKARHYHAILWAAGNGHLETLQYLETHLDEDEKKAAVKAKDDDAIQYAAENGQTATLQYLETHLTEDEKKAAVKAKDYDAIRRAAGNGHLETIQHLERHLTEDEKKEAVKAGNYGAIRWAAENGHLDILKYLETYLTEDEKKAAVRAENYDAIWRAAGNGYLETLKHLETHLTADEKKAAVKANDYGAIRLVAQKGHLETLQYLETHLNKDEKKAAVKARHYNAILLAAQNGHLETLEYLETHLTEDEKKAAAKADDYHAIRRAAVNGRLATLKHLEAHLTEDEKITAVKALNYEAIRCAAQYDYIDMVAYLLRYEPALAYMESHDREYGSRFIYPYISTMIEGLRQEREAYTASQMIEGLRQEREAYTVSHPQGVFDLDEDRARHTFYVLRNLIRRGVERDWARAEHFSDTIRELMTIPSVKGLCHQSLGENGQENELLRLAMRLGNEQAASILLEITEVREAAEAQDFYAAEAAGGVDLRQLAADRESSMTALTTDEAKRLERVIEKYKPLQDAAGIANLFNDLRQTLEARYERHPAQITSADGVSINLPLDWESFNALNLSDADRGRALEAYYKHDTHTAWRYLSKPNSWIAADSSWVNVNPADTTQRWSTFEGCIPLITLMYSAAVDETEPGINGYTPETRLEHFIRELALIGRAHNWDDTRVNLKTGKREEYDDLGPDKPSCFSGVKRRLFQSLVGHPLVAVLTIDVLTVRLMGFIREETGLRATLLLTEQLLTCMIYYQSALRGLDYDGEKPQSFDIGTEAKQAFIARMQAEYGDCLTDDLMRMLQRSLSALGDFLVFCGAYNLYPLLESALKERGDGPYAYLGDAQTFMTYLNLPSSLSMRELLMFDDIAKEALSLLSPIQLGHALGLNGGIHHSLLLGLSLDVFTKVIRALTCLDLTQVLFSEEEEGLFIDRLLSGKNNLTTCFKAFVLSEEGLDHLLGLTPSPVVMFSVPDRPARMHLKAHLLTGAPKLTLEERASLEKSPDIKTSMEIIAKTKGVTLEALFEEMCASQAPLSPRS